MSNYKNNNLSPASREEQTTSDAKDNSGYEATLRNGRVRNLLTPDGRDMGGWDSYRRWLSRVQAPERKRMPVDPGLYTWKGYRSWSEKIRRDWKRDE